MYYRDFSVLVHSSQTNVNVGTISNCVLFYVQSLVRKRLEKLNLDDIFPEISHAIHCMEMLRLNQKGLARDGVSLVHEAIQRCLSLKPLDRSEGPHSITSETLAVSFMLVNVPHILQFALHVVTKRLSRCAMWYKQNFCSLRKPLLGINKKYRLWADVVHRHFLIAKCGDGETNVVL